MAYIGTQPKDIRSFGKAKFDFTATQGQTAFTGADLNNQVLACNPADMDVHLNGVRLDATDWTATATTLTLAVGATAGDEVTVSVRQTFEVADTYAKTTADDRFVNAAGDTMTGNLTVVSPDNSGSTNIVTAVSNNLGQSVSLTFTGLKSNASAGIGFVVNETTGAMSIDTAGRVTMPQQPAIQISAMNVAVGSYSTGGTVYVQTGGISYNSSTGAITVPVAGNYRITYAGFSSAANSYVMMSLRKNGGHYAASECFAASNGGWIYVSANQTVIVNMSTSDYIQVYCNGGSPYTAGGGGNSISMELIG